MFFLDSAPIGCEESKLLNSFTKISITKQVPITPYGRVALDIITGGVVKSEIKKLNSSTDLNDEKFDIPKDVTIDNLSKFNYYQLLGLKGDGSDNLDLERIKRAYHKAVLVYHPDKTMSTSGKFSDDSEENAVFLKIQEAFTTLCNEQKRKVYDSQLPFDESIPSEELIAKKMAKNPANFFKLFDPVFKRNARFAAVLPVPEIGDMNTPMDEVESFYKYWDTFESWRDFSGVDAEHKPDDAQSRDEKRWMQKENEKNGKKLKKKEMDRLIRLVASAKEKDPRIVAIKETKRLAKEAEKRAKEEEIALAAKMESLFITALEEAEKVAKEAQVASKADREKAKKAISKSRNIFRKLLRHTAVLKLGDASYGILTEEDMELLCSTCSIQEIDLMNSSMGGEAATKDTSLFIATGVTSVHDTINLVKERSSNKKKESSTAASREWSADYFNGLAKALGKFTSSTKDRWNEVAKLMNSTYHPAVAFTATECENEANEAVNRMKK